MKLAIKKYLISVISLVCLITFSSCAYFYEKNTPEYGKEEHSTLSTSVAVQDNNSSLVSDDSADKSESAPESEDKSENPSESENQSTQVSESYPVSESEYVSENSVDFEGSYTTKEDVALYIHTYGCLPSNFMTKDEARKLGWEGGSLEPYAPGMCIGGNYFGNYEGLLPEEDGREYTECDIDTLGASSRGAKRIVFSNDGLIYYTEDHYETFELLYGEE